MKFERTKPAAVNRLPLILPRIIPGDWGQVEPGWLVQLLLKARREARREAEFTSSSGDVRASSAREKGTAR
jgi:hypothetical protein